MGKIILYYQIKRGVNPATVSEPEFFVLFTILNMNVYFHYQHESFALGKLFQYDLLN